MKRVLVTGGRGFIGRHTLSALCSRDFEVHVLDLKSEADISDNIVWHNCNLSHQDEVEKIMHMVKPTHLLHLAWYTAPELYWKSIENVEWVKNSISLLRCFADCGGLRYVIAGSCAEYDWSYGLLSETNTPMNPGTLYGICKDGLHRLAKGFAQETGLSYAWGRVFFLYGPNENENRLVSYVVKSLLEEKVARCSSGAQIRDYLFVQDVADAFAELIDSSAQGAFNIGSGEGVHIKDIILKLGVALNRSDLIKMGALQTSTNEPHIILADISKIRKEVCWKPKVSLDDGLAQTIQWCKERYKIKV